MRSSSFSEQAVMSSPPITDAAIKLCPKLFMTEPRDVRKRIAPHPVTGQEFPIEKLPSTLDPYRSILLVARRLPRHPTQWQLRTHRTVGAGVRADVRPSVRPEPRLQHHTERLGAFGVEADPQIIRRRGR